MVLVVGERHTVTQKLIVKQGSIGQNQDPGRVFPGKKMAGHMGNVRRTQQNLAVVNIDAERELLFVKGSVPGAKGQDLAYSSVG